MRLVRPLMGKYRKQPSPSRRTYPPHLSKLEVVGGAEVDHAGLFDLAEYRRPLVGALGHLDLLHLVEAFHDPAEGDALGVEPGQRGGGDEELRVVGVRPLVGHRQDARRVEFDGEALVGEGLAEDALAGVALPGHDVPSLHPAPGNDAVELRPFVFVFPRPLAQAREVLARLWADVEAQLDLLQRRTERQHRRAGRAARERTRSHHRAWGLRSPQGCAG